MRLARTAVALLGLLTACGSAVTTTEQLLDASTTAATSTTATAASTAPETSQAAPLISAGCNSFDSLALTDLSPIDNELALLEDSSTADSLVCNFVGVQDGLDTGIRIEVERVADQPEGHYVTPGQVESPVELAGYSGVGSGRGLIRLQLSEDIGVTIAVTIRSLSSSATIPRDGAFLDIRDAVATYVAGQLT
ncbi:MAG: hypothetical protein HKN91_11445 [Acidimicrobiia bacterium]|nr:hypothetical protein [Acidimicrobiia bacterium]